VSIWQENKLLTTIVVSKATIAPSRQRRGSQTFYETIM
jgi:hypothetical protein